MWKKLKEQPVTFFFVETLQAWLLVHLPRVALTVCQSSDKPLCVWRCTPTFQGRDCFLASCIHRQLTSVVYGYRRWYPNFYHCTDYQIFVSHNHGVIFPVSVAEQFQGFYSNLFQRSKHPVSISEFWESSFGSRKSKWKLPNLSSSPFIRESFRLLWTSTHPHLFRASVIPAPNVASLLPVCSTAPWVFTKVLTPGLALLHSHGISIVGYSDDLQLEQSAWCLSKNIDLTVQTL